MEWQPLSPATPVRDPARIAALRENLIGTVFADGHVATAEEIDETIERSLSMETWKNDLYTVTVNRDEDAGFVHLSIKRNDRGTAKDWRHFQAIKNQLVGEDCEGLELYPAEERVVDTANQYHLWVFTDPTYRIPVGFPVGLKMDPSDGTDGTRQRPLGQTA